MRAALKATEIILTKTQNQTYKQPWPRIPGSLILKAALLICTLKLDLGGRQQRFSTWNVTMLRNKLSENVACITWP